MNTSKLLLGRFVHGILLRFHINSLGMGRIVGDYCVDMAKIRWISNVTNTISKLIFSYLLVFFFFWYFVRVCSFHHHDHQPHHPISSSYHLPKRLFCIMCCIVWLFFPAHPNKHDTISPLNWVLCFARVKKACYR